MAPYTVRSAIAIWSHFEYSLTYIAYLSKMCIIMYGSVRGSPCDIIESAVEFNSLSITAAFELGFVFWPPPETLLKWQP